MFRMRLDVLADTDWRNTVMKIPLYVSKIFYSESKILICIFGDLEKMIHTIIEQQFSVSVLLDYQHIRFSGSKAP